MRSNKGFPLKINNRWLGFAAVLAVMAGGFVAFPKWHTAQAAGTPDAVNDSLVLYQDSGSVILNWSANDDLTGNATLDAFDTPSVNAGTVTDNGNGTFTYTPANGYSGGDGFTYTICNDDPVPLCDTANVSITVVATSTCLSGFYQALSGSINIMDTTTTPASYVTASANISSFNAAGYNPNDGLIYGFTSTTGYIVSFDPKTGDFANVYNAGAGSYNTGDFDSSNNLYYVSSNQTTMHVYNTVTDTHSTITLPSALGAADIAYVPSTDKFYGVKAVSGTVSLVILDLTGPTVSTLTATGAIASETGSFGAAWVTGSTTLYVYNNTTGNIFSVDTTTGASTLVSNSAPNGNNDGMSCAAAASPFDVTSILDYGDAPDSYGTLLASDGASAVVNTSYRIGNYTDIEADGQPTVGADGDDTTGIGTDEDGVTVGVTAIQSATLYEGEISTVKVSVPLDAGYVSMWIDHDNNGTFDVGEEVASDVVSTGGTATLNFTLSNTLSSPLSTYARIRLAARTGGAATGNYSFGEVEDYTVTINPSRPTITNNALSAVTAANYTAYTVSGVCSDDGDTVNVSVTDGTHTVNATATTCSGGTFSRTVDLTSLDDGSISVASTITDGINPAVTDTDAIAKDIIVPTITNNALSAVTAVNQASYTINGTCTADGDTINVSITDGTHTVNATATTCSGGTFSRTVDLTSLDDGSLTVTSQITDGVGNTATDADTTTKDTTALAIAITTPVTDITLDNADAYPVAGTCATIGDSITVAITDGSVTAQTTLTCTDDGFGSGEFAATVDLSGLAPGTLTITATISDGVNPDATDTESVSLPTDLDDDDTTSTVEMAGPNGGDGNNDGTPDYLQDSVTTKIDPIIGDYTTFAAAGGCTQFKSVDFYRASDLPVSDGEYNYELGLNGFVIDCAAPGSTVAITIYWDKVYDTARWSYRKYVASQSKYVDFNSTVTYGTAMIGGKQVTTVQFSITDGGIYDGDGLANGTIVDPAGPAVLADQTTVATPAAPDTGVAQNNQNSPEVFMIIGLGLTLLALTKPALQRFLVVKQ